MPEVPTQLNGRPVQWVNVNGGEPPEEKPPLPRWARVLVFAGGCVLGFLLIGLFIWSIFGFSTGMRDAEKQNVENALTEGEAACAAAKDSVACLANMRQRLASQSGDVTYCNGLEGTQLDGCIALAAATAENRSLCGGITEEVTRANCMDALFVETFGRDHGFETCAEYINEGLQRMCEENWVRTRAQANDCSSEFVDDALCTAGEVIARAVAARNPDICGELTAESDRGACTERVGAGDRDFDGVPADEEARIGTSDTNSDSDGDGLSDFEELFEYFTDPARADTDGDGFSDSEEVQNGFDPLS